MSWSPGEPYAYDWTEQVAIERPFKKIVLFSDLGRAGQPAIGPNMTGTSGRASLSRDPLDHFVFVESVRTPFSRDSPQFPSVIFFFLAQTSDNG
jgi:hypothetical protein